MSVCFSYRPANIQVPLSTDLSLEKGTNIHLKRMPDYVLTHICHVLLTTPGVQVSDIPWLLQETVKITSGIASPRAR